MSSRVIIPEVVGEGGDRSQGWSRPQGKRPPGFQPPAVGMGAMLRALGAGVVLLVAVSAIFLLGFTIMLIFGAIFAVLGLVALLRSKFGKPSSSVVFRSTRTDRSGNTVVLLEHMETRRRGTPDGAGRE